MDKKAGLWIGTGIFAIILAGVLAAVFYFSHIFNAPGDVDLTLHGIELNSKGKIVDEGDLHLSYTAVEENGLQIIYNLSVTFSSFSFSQDDDTAPIVTQIGSDLSYQYLIFDEYNRPSLLTMHTDQNQGWYLFEISSMVQGDENARYVVASADKNVDIAGILKVCGQSHS